jgi:putative CocE/NonD family hydrolase
VTRDVKITMRDGVQLAADVHYPTNPDGSAAPGPFPTLVSQTPYGKNLTGQDILDEFSGLRPYLVQRGYIDVVVDVRGSGGSQGNLTLFGADEAADSKQVIAWASKLPHATGAVGLTGESYLGIDQLFAAAAVGRHSPLKAIFPISASNDPYKDLFVSGGLLNIESDPALLGVYTALPLVNPLAQAALDPRTLSGYGPLLAQRLQGLRSGFAVPTLADLALGGDRAYEDAYWQDPQRRPAAILKRIVDNGIPAYLVGGLYDVFQRGEPLNYVGLQNAWAGRPTSAPMNRTQKVTSRYQLLIKPSYHGTADNGTPDLDVLQLAWFDHWLKGRDTGVERTSTPLHVVQANGTRLEADRFPLRQATTHTVYLGDGGTLTAGRPARSGADTLAFTGVSLPCDRSTEQWALGEIELGLELLHLGDPCAGQDVVPASVGPGQLTYTTAPFTRDTVLGGPLAATIYATANTKDTEWIAKVSDVAPNGSSTDLTQGALAGSHRALDEARTWRDPDGDVTLPYHPDTRASKVAVVPGARTRYDIEIRSTFATLKAGHRIRLTLLSSQSPHLVPVPTDIANFAGGVYEVQHGPAAPSSLQLPLADPSSFAPRAVCAAPQASISRRTLRVSRTRLALGGRTLVPCAGRPVRRVQVAVARRSGTRCRWLKRGGRFTRATSCRRPVLHQVRGTTRWRFVARHTRLARGRYVAYSLATDAAGHRQGRPATPSLRFRVRR